MGSGSTVLCPEGALAHGPWPVQNDRREFHVCSVRRQESQNQHVWGLGLCCSESAAAGLHFTLVVGFWGFGVFFTFFLGGEPIVSHGYQTSWSGLRVWPHRPGTARCGAELPALWPSASQGGRLHH